MKSAKSRIDSDSMRGSLASGLVITFLLGDGLWPETPESLPLLPLLPVLGGLAGNALLPNALFLSASTRGYTVTAVVGRSGSVLRTTGGSCSMSVQVLIHSETILTSKARMFSGVKVYLTVSLPCTSSSN